MRYAEDWKERKNKFTYKGYKINKSYNFPKLNLSWKLSWTIYLKVKQNLIEQQHLKCFEFKEEMMNWFEN